MAEQVVTPNMEPAAIVALLAAQKKTCQGRELSLRLLRTLRVSLSSEPIWVNLAFCKKMNKTVLAVSVVCISVFSTIGCQTAGSYSNDEINWILPDGSTSPTFVRNGSVPSNVYDMRDLDNQPKMISGNKPEYPYELRRNKVEGTVYVVLTIDEAGVPVRGRVRESPHEGFIESALEAAISARFEPGLVDGAAVAFEAQLPMYFEVP